MKSEGRSGGVSLALRSERHNGQAVEHDAEHEDREERVPQGRPIVARQDEPTGVRRAAMPRMIPAWAAIRRPSARSLPASTLPRRIGATKNLSMNPDSRSDTIAKPDCEAL